MWVDVPRVMVEEEDRFVIAAVLRSESMSSPSLTMASPSECATFLRVYGTAGLDQARRSVAGIPSPCRPITDNVIDFPSGAA